MADQDHTNDNSLFIETNIKFGLQLDYSNFNLDGSSNDPVIFSGNSSESSFPPFLHEVKQLAELKALIGSDLINDEFVVYPTPYTLVYEEILKAIQDGIPIEDKLTKTICDNLDVAYAAYLNGDASKVSAYVDLLEAMRFPLALAFFASKDTVVVDQDIQVTGYNPVVLNCESIKFSGSGGISSDTELTIISNSMSK